MRKFCFASVFCCSLLISNAQNFLNGDFENNSAGGGDQINLSNAAFNSMMPNTTAFGTYGDMDIITSATYSGLAQSGNWYVAFTGSGTDMIAMQLSAPLVAGNSYTISFYDRGASGYTPYPFQIGLSTSSTSFGTAIYTAPVAPTIGVWTQRVFTFIAPNNGQYITCTMTAGGLGDWAHTDNFTFLCSLNLGPDTAICGGSSYTINATTAGATAYLWQDGSTNPTYNVTTPGLYWAQVTAGGCTLRDTVIVSAGATGSLNLGNDTTICTSNTVVLNASTTGATAYLWQDNSTNPTYTVSSTGTYWARVTAGGCTFSDTVNVTVGATGSLNLGNDTTICSGNAVVLNATTAGATSYLWQDGSTNPTYAVTTTGTYWVQVNLSSCITSDTISITVYNVPSQSFSVNPSSVCVGNPVTVAYTGGSSALATYNWNFNGGTISSGSGQGPYQILWFSAGNYNVTLDVTDNGCTATQVINSVTINAGVSPNAGPDITVCSGGSVQLGAATTAGHTYQWNPSTDISTSNISDPVYSAHNLTGSPVVTQYVLTESVSGCSATDTVNVSLSPVAPTTISAGSATSFCSGGSVTITADSAYTSYLWSDNSIGSSITVSQAGIFSMSAVDANGCEYLSNSIPVTVNPNPVISLVFLNGETCFGINDGSIDINATNGTPTYVYSWSNGNSTEDVSNLAAGIYSVTVSDVNSCTATASYAIAAALPFSISVNSVNNVSCFGANDGSIDISAIGGSSPYQFNWSSGNISSSISNISAGNYSVTISDANNCTIDSSFVIAEPVQIIFPSMIFDSVRFSTQVVLNTTIQPAETYTYQWNPTQSLSCSDCANPTFAGNNSMEYSVTATDANNCSATAVIKVNVIADKKVFVPNAFTPNGDGQNDKWLVSATGIVFIDLKIFNRWGEKVFETNNVNEGWDGNYKGKNAYAGVYSYVLTAVFLDGESRKYIGGVTLIR